MGQFVADDVFDAALAEVASAARLVVCSGQPANYAGIAAVALAEVALTPGTGNGDHLISDGDTSGRKDRIAAQSDIPITASGTATHVALDDGSALLAVTTCAAHVLTSGGTVSTPAFDVEFIDVASNFGAMPDIGWTPTLVTDRDMSSISQSGWGIVNSENLSLLTDASDDPVSPPTAIHELTPEGTPGGSSAAVQEYQPINGPSPPRRILTRDIFYFDDDWNVHPILQKRVFHTINGANSFYTCAWPDGDDLYFGCANQGIFSSSNPPGLLSQNYQTFVAAAKLERNQFAILWTEITVNTAGNEDARIRQWVDKGSGPVLTIDTADDPFNAVFAFVAGDGEIESALISTMRGGSGSDNPSDCHTTNANYTIWEDAA